LREGAQAFEQKLDFILVDVKSNHPALWMLNLKRPNYDPEQTMASLPAFIPAALVIPPHPKSPQ
jgi:hypothetical protein